MRRPASRVRRGAARAAAEPLKRPAFMPDQLIIRFKPDAFREAIPAARASFRGLHAKALANLPEQVLRPLDYLRQRMGVKTMTPLFATRRPQPARLRGVRGGASRAAATMSVSHASADALSGINLIQTGSGRVDAQTLKALAASPAVDYVERMPARWLAGAKASDPRRNAQWGLRAIGWFDQPVPSAREVMVAVLDTGVDARHPDLKGMIAKYDHGRFSAEDIVGHGTHVSGIINAATNNDIGITGIADCRLGVWKIFPDKPYLGDYYVDGERYLQALRAAQSEGARVINLSIGGTESSETERLLFQWLLDQGVTVVAAMGNEYREGNPVEYPAAFPGVIAVGAVGVQLRRASFSNTGPHIHVVAPGVNILSTLPMKPSSFRPDQTEYEFWDGTSMASPHAAAVVALLLAKDPTLAPADVRDALARRAKKVKGMGRKKRTNAYGFGLVYLPQLLARGKKKGKKH